MAQTTTSGVELAQENEDFEVEAYTPPEPTFDEPIAEDQVLPPVEQWDYSNALVNHRGEQLPEGASQWRPDGMPHFGTGVVGKLKSYWWNFTKDVPNTASVEEMSDLWRKGFGEGTKDEKIQAGTDFFTNITDAFSGKGAPLSDEEQAELDALQSRVKGGGEPFTDEEKARIKELTKGEIDQSLLSGVRRGVGAGVTAGLDLFNSSAYGAKQAMGASRAVGETLQELGDESSLPSLVGDVDKEEAAQFESDYKKMVASGEINPTDAVPSIAWQGAKNALKSALLNTPLGLGYNAIRTALAPTDGKWDTIKERAEQGWDSGRVLYTQAIDPMVRYEYERRLNEGEDPEVLSLELANPWAEMAGEILFDPLNVVGAVFKGGKVAGKIDEAVEGGQSMIKLLDPTMEESVQFFKAASTDEGVMRVVMETAESYAKETAQRVEVRAQKYGWTQLTSTSQKARLQRDMANFFGTTVSGMIKDGRGADDIADIMKYGIMSVSDDVDEVAEGIMGLMNSSVPKQFFSELGNDSLATVRRMITNSDGALDATKITKALASDTPLESVMKIADDAAAQRFASVQEMEKAAKAVESGKFTDKQAKLAKAYDAVPEFVKQETKLMKLPEYAKNKVNSGLGFFYFTINPGTAVRNSISNKMFIMMDEGIGAFFEGGVFKGVNDIQGHLKKHLGFDYRVGETFGSQAGEAAKLQPIQKLGQAIEGAGLEGVGKAVGSLDMGTIEAADALRVVDTRYTEAFSKITDTALPFDDALKQAGMTNKQFNLFKNLVKKEGNMQDAMQAFNKTQGLADWRTLDFLNPTQVRGLQQAGGVWDELLDFATDASKTLDDVDAFIDGKLKAYEDIASKAVDDVPGFGHNWASSQDAAKYVGRAVDEKLISSADYTKMGQAQEAAEQAIDLYKNNLIDEIKKLSEINPEAAAEIGIKNQELMLQSEAAGKMVRQKVDGMWQKVWDTKKGGAPDPRVWSELGMEGVPPADKGEFFNELFSQARAKRSAMWEEHFAGAIGRSEDIIADLEKSGLDTNDLNNLFERARGLDAKAQEIKSAFYLNNGKAYTGAPPKGTKLGQMDYDSTNKFLESMGWDRGSATSLKNAVNKDLGKNYKKWQDVPWNEALDSAKGRIGQVVDDISIEKAAEIPRSDLPQNVSSRIEQQARSMLSDFRAGKGPEASVPGQVAASEGAKVTNIPSTNVPWYRELPKNMQKRDRIDKALTKIIEDAGKDKGVQVERMKDLILDVFTYGDEATGTPPDLAVLKSLDAGDNVLNDALNVFNDMTGNNFTLDEALRASGFEEAIPGADDLLKNFEPKQVMPVHPTGADASVPRQYLETQKGFTETMEYLRSQIKEQWGVISPTDNVATSQALADYGSKYANRLIDAKSMALKNAEYWRDFTLLGYSTDKTFGNLAQSYVMPYAFWYSGTYRNMMQRMVTDPQVIAAYSKYRSAVEQEHRFAPDWFRQQVQIDDLPGIDLKDPLFFNLEQTLNPLNGLTGADFMDKSKRVNWWTSTIDDMGKFGPSVWAPIQIAVATSFAMQNDQELALRWAGRLAPQTPAIKAASSLLFGKPIETDPNVLLFGGGDSPFDIFGAMDSFERSRVGRAVGDLQVQETQEILNDPSLTPEQKQQAIAELEARYTDVAYAQDGPEWQQAYVNATNLRAPGQITSPLLGVGFKARTRVDLEIDEMYTQMNMLMTMRDGMTQDDYQKGWQQMREQFPFMDTVLLARKGGDLRDGAYAYNVLARIMPGKTDDIYREMNIKDLADKFYENKGSMEGWKDQDKDRFMAAIVDIGATFAIPPDATRQEWDAAKDASGDMYDALTEKYGEDIFDKLTEYYGARDEGYQNGNTYLQMHPEVKSYMDDKNAYVANNPLLYKYYGSLQTIENYYDSNLRAELAEKYGDDIFSIAAEYSSIPKLDKDARRQWWKDNPDKGDRLSDYNDDLYDEETERNVNEAILRMYEDLPEAEEPILRGDPDTVAQQALVDAVSSNQPAVQEIVSQMSPPLLELVSEYWTGEDLPEQAEQQLKYIGDRYGLSPDDLLVILAAQR